MLVLGVTSLAHASKSIQPQHELTVFDAEGQKVGDVLGFVGWEGTGAPAQTPIPVVALRVDGDLVILQIGRDGALDPPPGGVQGIALYFESPDCTGTPFLASGLLLPEGSPLPATYLAGQQVFVQDGPPQTLVVASSFDPSSGSCNPFEPTEVSTLRLRFLIDLTTEFTPPFTVR
jgi:hypothetical protein